MNIYKTILGMDKLASHHGFSVVVMNESGIVLRGEILSIEAVAEVSRAQKADAVAIDNIYELGSESDIRRFTSLLYKEDLIQVTGSPTEGFRPLAQIAKELGLGSGEKLSPARSAEVCARSVMAGFGFVVKVFEPETRITISRRRKFGSGGMSEGRYRRSIQGSVLNLTNSIRSALKTREIDFDLSMRKGSHGIEGSSFIVYASRNRLFGIVRPLRTSSINVKVTPVFTKSLDLVPLGGMDSGPPRRYLLVGVDPGMVTGLAMVDLNGRVLLTTSGRGITRGQITRTLSSLGRALVFATDVNPAPATLAKLAASHKALLFTPERSLKTLEKKELVEHVYTEQKAGAEDSHQRDALAAALKAYSFYRNKLEQVVSHVQREDRTILLEEVKASVLRGMSISDAIEASRAPMFEEAVPKKRLGSESEQIKILKMKLDDMTAERDELITKVDGLKEDMEDLKNDLRLAKLEKRPERPPETETYELERRVRSLLAETTKLRGLIELIQAENLRMTRAFDSLSLGDSMLFKRYRNVAEAVREQAGKKEGRAAVVERVGQLSEEVLKGLRNSGIEAIVVAEISEEEKAQLFAVGMPVVLLSSIISEAYSSTQIITRSSLEKAIEGSNKELHDFSTVKAGKLKELFEEYKRERFKETQ